MTSTARTDTSREQAILDYARELLGRSEPRVEYIRRGFARQWGRLRVVYDPAELRERLASVDEEPVTEVRWHMGPGPVVRLEATFTQKWEVERVIDLLPGGTVEGNARRLILGRLRDADSLASTRTQPETVISVLAIHYLSRKGGGSLSGEAAKDLYDAAEVGHSLGDGWRKQSIDTLARLEARFGPLP